MTQSEKDAALIERSATGTRIGAGRGREFVPNPTIFISAGEPSGDLHAANLIRALRRQLPGVKTCGYGGPRMRSAGCEVHVDLTERAVMWVGRVVTQLPRFWQLLRQLDRQFQQSPPDAVVLVDYPGFNWHVARCAKAHAIPVIYYGVPQLWAWAPWRAGKMRRLVDHALCKLPFETPWLRARGIHAEYVGHPYFDELTQRELDSSFINAWRQSSSPLVTLLPGSRRQEVEGHAPWMLDAARILRQRHPACRFAFACFNDPQADFVRTLVRNSGIEVDVVSGRTPELIELATCAIACSGSVSLELLYHRTPTAVFYRVGTVGYMLQDLLRTSRYITLGNLLAAGAIARRPGDRLTNDELRQIPFPEYVAVRNCARQLADHLDGWLASPEQRNQKVRQLDEFCQKYALTGASERAATRIRELLL